MKDIIKGYYSYCCRAPVYVKGKDMGLFCSECNKEVFKTVDKGKDDRSS